MPTPTVVLLLLACARWYGACPCPARCARSCLLACRARASSCRHLARLPLLFEFVRRCRPAVRVSRRCWLRAALCGCAEDSGVALLCASGLKNLQTSVSPPPAKLAPDVPQLPRPWRCPSLRRSSSRRPRQLVELVLSWYILLARPLSRREGGTCLSGLPAHNLPPARIGRSRSSQQTSQRGHAVPVLPRPWWVAWYS